LAWLQNRIATAADEVLTYEYKSHMTEKAAIIEHEKLKARYSALVDLLDQLTAE
jgi:predicted component of type VI protein secretion system